MKKVLYLFSLLCLIIGCANAKPAIFKTSALEGKKTSIIEEKVEETSASIFGETTKKVIKRTPLTSSAITLSEQNSYEDENVSLKFTFNTNNLDVAITNKQDRNASLFTDYAYFISYGGKKYRMILEESWKDNKNLIGSQPSPVIEKSSTTLFNLTPELCIDFTSGSGADNYSYWRTASLDSLGLGNKNSQDYIEILIPIKLDNTIYTYLFKTKLLK